MSKNVHLICNAHLDPVWQWEWEEGAAEAISTFRVAADFCDQYGDFIFCHNEALLYRWVEEYEPELFERIKKLVKAGKWHIMGGWHLQPDCNMPSGEGFARQMLEGRRYFEEKFGVRPTTAINFDPFGHTRGLVQLMVKFGYDSYVFCRPAQNDCQLPAETFKWVGYDGSSVSARRVACGYNSGLGHAADKIRSQIETIDENEPCGIVLWGVGDHGGGASKIDLDAIAGLKGELAAKGFDIFHSTPEKYFAELDRASLPEHRGDLNSWAPGCYTTQIRVKQKYRALEQTLFMTEKMCSAAEAFGMKYPREELAQVQYDLLTVQFHDSLPGSSIQPVEEMALRMLDHGLEILSRVKARAFFKLAAGQRKAASDEIPVLVYNPHPYPVEDDFECEFMLWDQNWKEEFTMPQVFRDGKPLPSQPEKEYSNLPLDWRKRVVFHATLAPSSMNRFDCRFTVLPEKPKARLDSEDGCYVFRSGDFEVKINRSTGLIDSVKRGGTEYLEKGAFRLDVIRDNFDPWGMTVNRFTDKIGSFELLTDEEGSKFSNQTSVIPSVRVIEDGEVRTVVQAVFGYNSSRAVVDYKLKKTGGIDVSLRLIWDEKCKMVKFALTPAFKAGECVGEVAYGAERLRLDGRENVSQRYMELRGEKYAVSAINDGTYGSSFENNTLSLTLLRSPGYTAHPIGDRVVMPSDRHSAYVDQGERLYNFAFDFGETAEIYEKTPRFAENRAQKPMALSFFPSGTVDKNTDGTSCKPFIELTGDEMVEASVIKGAEDGRGYIVRLFNPSDKLRRARLTAGEASGEFELGAFGLVTVRVFGGKMAECSIDEKDC